MSRRSRSDTPKRDQLFRGPTGSAVLRESSISDEVNWLIRDHPWPQAIVSVSPGPLDEVEDNRVWRPDVLRAPGVRGLAPARLLSGAPARLQSLSEPSRPSWPLGFQEANKVVRCMRREQRKQVLHALNKTGKGSGYGKKSRNVYSNVRCK